MVNISVLIGTGYYGEDVLHKLPWLNNLNKEHEIHVASRINPDVHMNKYLKKVIGEELFFDTKNSLQKLRKKTNFEVIYDSQHLKKYYDSKETEELQKWIGISLRYISSFDRRFYNRKILTDTRNKIQLNNYISGLIKFFNEFFIKNEIDYLINTIEDDIFSVTAYYVAKRLNIKILGFVPGRFPKKGMMFSDDFNNICTWKKKNGSYDLLSLYDDSTISGENTLKNNLDYWSLRSVLKRLKSIKKNVINYKHYVKYVTGKYEYENFIFESSNYRVKKYPIELLRKILIKTLILEPKYSEKYFLFPLHYLEDAQITFREPFLDQINLIKNISRALPLNHYLYVKPHPHYLGTDIEFKEIYKLSKFENIKIINPTCPPIKLIKNSKGVITINSTTGFESLIMGIPVITLGHEFYCKEELCNVIKDINELANSLLIHQNKSESKITQNFINKIYENTIWIEGVYYNEYKAFGLTPKDGSKIASALNTILEN